uniref:transposase n=1 Tax=Globicatella sulfidifaciens TaxID=136093 RepID=UPI0035D9073F
MTYRNGYYDRDYTTKLGTLNLRVPKSEDGKFSTEIFERYQRNEKALLLTMLEMYIQGIFTTKVSKAIENLYGKIYSKPFVFPLTKQLDEEVRQWRHHDLSPVLMNRLFILDLKVPIVSNAQMKKLEDGKESFGSSLMLNPLIA